MNEPTKASVFRHLDGLYLLEYLSFSGQIREYMNDTLSKAFRADPNDVRRRHHVVSLVQLEYAAYEDTAALLKSLAAFRSGERNTVLETLEGYKPGDAVLPKVFEEHGIETGDDLFDRIRLGAAIPTEWTEWFPSLNLEKALRLACEFFVNDCRGNQKQLGIAAYNKSKHGPLVVSDGSIFGPLSPVPSMFFANKWPAEYGANPVIVYGFPIDDEKIEERERLIQFVQRSLRLIVACVVGANFPDEVRDRHGSLQGLWEASYLLDVRELIDEITRKK